MSHVQKKCRSCRRSVPDGERSCQICGSREISYVARYIDPDGKDRSKSFRRRAEADRYAEKQKDEIKSGDWIDPERSSVTLAEFWEEQRDRPGAHGLLAPSTHAKYQGIWSIYLREPLGAYPLHAITRQDARDIVNAIASPWQAAEALKLLRLLLYRAIDDNRLKSNPAARVRSPKATRAKIRVLKPNEINAVIEALPEEYGAFVMVGAYCSLRWSEVVALRRDDVDIQRRTLRIDEAVTEVDGAFHWGKPKTEGSARVVSMPSTVAASLAQHMLAYPPTTEGLVFYGETNEPVRRKTFRRAWLAALAEAKIDGHVRVAWLRHTGASLAYHATKDIRAVADRMGHTSTRMVDQVYVELYDDVSREVSDAIDDLIRRSSP